MQKPGGESITGTCRVDHLRRLKSGLCADLILHAPMDRSGTVGDHHIRFLRENSSNCSRIHCRKKPQRLLPSQLDQGRLLQQRAYQLDSAVVGPGRWVSAAVPKGGPPVHIDRECRAIGPGLGDSVLQRLR